MLNSSQYILYNSMFETAKREVCILTGKYDQNYADEFVNAAANFLYNPKHTLKIACMCGPVIECPTIQKISNGPDRKGELVVYESRAFQGNFYFTLTDKNGYRVERPGEEAQTSFEDTENAKHIASIFDTVILISPKIIHLQEIQTS